ncbi:hypothetical protein GQ55_2G320700 [Panicum hallii var. hallii]|uniref:Uncharacterized protein n=3 Tax=Panicum sect. Panicum TaxID=2100772 RepID=A0A3L6QT65_PANMI|nr:uncharacterized protein LOC112882942 [Panicum hallii]PAN13363.1 hypothetical protein PAHAL_2G331200 [Panicum hallii]PUZ71539.1 hypothetical protein GQ55_2G320700 [Panicum hallii var. hallii]RLM86873.1 uncharacterized protein C2845_PM04G22120 [Panicum miliaceum]
MASSRRLLAVFAVLAVVFLAGAGVAGAARPAPAGGGGEEAAAYLVVDPAAVVEKARETVEMLMARLPAGPSPRGPGH